MDLKRRLRRISNKYLTKISLLRAILLGLYLFFTPELDALFIVFGLWSILESNKTKK